MGEAVNAKMLLGELKILFQTFRQEPTPEALQGYREALEDLTDAELVRARQRACREWKPAFGRQMPVPAELREFAAPDVIEEPLPEIALPRTERFRMPVGGWRALFGHFNAERQRDGQPMLDPESFPPELLPDLSDDGATKAS